MPLLGKCINCQTGVVIEGFEQDLAGMLIKYWCPHCQMNMTERVLTDMEEKTPGDAA